MSRVKIEISLRGHNEFSRHFAAKQKYVNAVFAVVSQVMKQLVSKRQHERTIIPDAQTALVYSV